MLFFELPSESWQYQKQLMVKSEVHFDFRPLKKLLAKINRNFRKKKDLHLFLHYISMVWYKKSSQKWF